MFTEMLPPQYILHFSLNNMNSFTVEDEDVFVCSSPQYPPEAVYILYLIKRVLDLFFFPPRSFMHMQAKAIISVRHSQPPLTHTSHWPKSTLSLAEILQRKIQ